MPANKNIKVIGRVQGVFFRASTKDTADKMGIMGWVRNNLDGSVEIEAEGDEAQLRKFIEWCRRGPRFANVRDIQIKDGSLKHYHSFEILH